MVLRLILSAYPSVCNLYICICTIQGRNKRISGATHSLALYTMINCVCAVGQVPCKLLSCSQNYDQWSQRRVRGGGENTCPPPLVAPMVLFIYKKTNILGLVPVRQGSVTICMNCIRCVLQ